MVLHTFDVQKSCDELVQVFRIISSMLLGGGFKDILFLTLPGEMIQFDLRIFFRAGGRL